MNIIGATRWQSEGWGQGWARNAPTYTHDEQTRPTPHAPYALKQWYTSHPLGYGPRTAHIWEPMMEIALAALAPSFFGSGAVVGIRRSRTPRLTHTHKVQAWRCCLLSSCYHRSERDAALPPRTPRIALAIPQCAPRTPSHCLITLFFLVPGPPTGPN